MSRFDNWEQPIFDKDGWTKYGWKCQNYEGLSLGKGVDIGCFSYLNAKYGIEIGDNVQIGSHCSIYSINTENNTKGKVIIGENSLIGSFSLILPGVTIPPNSKIRAYSIIKE
jgi:acetyltransferase-like isoleucine patch superfamily enzyme